MESKFSLKDHLFNKPKVEGLANEIKEAYRQFNSEKFSKEVIQAFPKLELKERITHIAVCLRKYLPQDYKEAIGIILKALPQPLDLSKTDDDFGDFIHAPYSEFVALYGCEEKYFSTSANALYEMTKRFSVEFSIRIFINTFPEKMLQHINKWSTDKNYHVRRLCSEGTRTTLPWAKKISLTPEQTLPILYKLYADKTRYVTRSVANHLNDIAKKNPDLVLSTLKQWKTENKQSKSEMDFIAKHALRTLVKDGHPKALKFLGVSDSSGIEATWVKKDKSVTIGGAYNFSIQLKSKQSKKVIVDYIIHFKTQKGFSAKVFKLKAFDSSINETLILNKQHKFMDNMTTRKLYVGIHQLEIQVNGSVLLKCDFELLAK